MYLFNLNFTFHSPFEGDLDNHIEDEAMMDVGSPSDDEDENVANPDLIQQAIQRRLTG